MTVALHGLQVHAARGALLGPLDLVLAPGRCTGVVGESGSGKSLTALSLLGLLPQALRATGTLTVDGAPVPLGSPVHAALRGRMFGWVPQDPLAALHPLRTVGSQLRETLRAHGRDLADARTLLERVQLPDADSALAKYPHQFSGGQRQRIAIALALASGPRYLVADEPTSALDARIAREVLDLLDGLRRDDGLGLMLISHDLPLVGAYADEVVVLRRGQVAERGTTRAVFTAPADAYTRELLAADQLAPLPPPVEAPPVVVKAEAMRVHYPRARTPALDGVDLVLRRGEGLALLGESGSGKSTLGRALLRLLRGAQGRVWLDGTEFTALRGEALRAMRRRIGVVFQDPYASLDPRMRIGAVIAEPLRIHGIGDAASREARARALLEALGLDPAMADRWPHEASGGQRQRIAIARALACDPEVLVCDEAVSALDAHHRAGILRLLAELKRTRGLALLFVTHDLAAAAAVAERILVLEAGRVVEQGDTATVLAHPAHPHTRALVDARPRLPSL